MPDRVHDARLTRTFGPADGSPCSLTHPVEVSLEQDERDCLGERKHAGCPLSPRHKSPQEQVRAILSAQCLRGLNDNAAGCQALQFSGAQMQQLG